MWHLIPQVTDRGGTTADLMAHLSHNELDSLYDIEIVFRGDQTDIFGDAATDFVIPIEKIRHAAPNAQVEMIGEGTVIHVTADNLDEAITLIFDCIHNACRGHTFGKVGRKEIQIV